MASRFAKLTLLFSIPLAVCVSLGLLVLVGPYLSNRAASTAAAQYIDYPDVVQYDLQREGGHLVPNLDTLMLGARADQPARIVTNSKGFRNAIEFDYEVPKGVRRILFVGDSYVDGMRTDQERTIGYLLEQRLARDDPDGKTYQVLIAGNKNPANSWYYLQEHGRKFNPHIVILGVTLGNDLTWHNYKAGLIPEKTSDGETILSPADPAQQAGRNRDSLLLPDEAYTPPSVFDGLSDIFIQIQRALASSLDVFSQLAPPIMAPLPSTRRKVYTADFSVSLGLFFTPVLSEVEDMYEEFEEILLGVSDVVKRSEAELLVVLFPVRIQVSEDDWGRLVSAYSLDESRFDLDYPNRRILAFCEAHDIFCLDLLTRFKAAWRDDQATLYQPRGDMHFNDEGQNWQRRKSPRCLGEVNIDAVGIGRVIRRPSPASRKS